VIVTVRFWNWIWVSVTVWLNAVVVVVTVTVSVVICAGGASLVSVEDVSLVLVVPVFRLMVAWPIRERKYSDESLLSFQSKMIEPPCREA